MRGATADVVGARKLVAGGAITLVSLGTLNEALDGRPRGSLLKLAMS
jgi:hypothetical protein